MTLQVANYVSASSGKLYGVQVFFLSALGFLASRLLLY